MNGEKLFEAIGGIDGKYLVQDKKHKKKKTGILISSVACAAAAAIAVTLIQPWSFFAHKADVPAEPAPMPEYMEEESPVGAPKHPLGYLTDTEISYDISDYSDIDELLAHLGKNEQHTDSNPAGESSLRGDKNTLVSADVVAANGYSYHPTDDGVMITKLNGQTTENIGKIDLRANSIFLADDKLAVTSGYYEYLKDGSEIPYTTLSIYMNLFEDPSQPWLRDVYTVKGSYVDSFMHYGKLYLITEYGECACGYSHTDDKSKYLPYIHHSGVISEYEEETAFEEDDLTVLASPTRLSYTTVTAINMANGEITEAQAFYADTERVFISGGHIAFAVSENGRQSVYVFDALTMDFKGRIEPFEDSENNIMHTEILSFTRKDNTYRLVGQLAGKVLSGNENISTVFASAADTVSGFVSFDCYVPKEGSICSITEITDTEYGQVISFDETQYGREECSVIGRMMLADYTYYVDLKVSPDEFASVHGVDTAFYFGDPFGDITTLTDLGGGYYARTNELPDAFDIIEVGKKGITLKADTPSMLEGNERFVFKNRMINGRLCSLSFEGEDVFLNMYEVNAQESTPFKLIQKTPVKADPIYLETDALCGFEIIEHGGNYYYAHRTNDKLMPVNIPRS